MLGRAGIGLGLFVGSLAAGWWLGRRGWLTESQAKGTIRVTVKWISPVVLCLSFWSLNLAGRDVWLLPLMGCLASLSTLLPAWLYARAVRLTRPQAGTFLACAVFSNLGFFGAFIAFALFGEVGYGLSTLYLVYFSPCFYLVGFTIGKRYQQEPHPAASSTWFSDELRWYPFLGLLVGMAFSLARLPRPSLGESLNHVLIPLSTAAYLVAVGSQLHVETMSKEVLGAGLAMSAIKFWYTPLVGWALVSLFRVEGIARFIVLLQTAMPVAISPLMLAMVFGLDRRLASALWLFTTCLAIPWLLVYLPLIR